MATQSNHPEQIDQHLNQVVFISQHRDRVFRYGGLERQDQIKYSVLERNGEITTILKEGAND